MTWKELSERISRMSEEEQQQNVAIWGENFSLRDDCRLVKTDEAVFYNTEWDETCLESNMDPEDFNNPDTYMVCGKGMYYVFG